MGDGTEVYGTLFFVRANLLRLHNLQKKMRKKITPLILSPGRKPETNEFFCSECMSQCIVVDQQKKAQLDTYPCNEPTPASFRSGCNGPEATIKSNRALSHILRRVVSG